VSCNEARCIRCQHCYTPATLGVAREGGVRQGGSDLSQVLTWGPGSGFDAPFSADSPAGARNGWGGIYAALDLGTNNCRLLVARPTAQGFRVIDAFSRIVRLGEGLSLTGRLSEAAIARTLDALKVCRDKMLARGVTRARTIATEACRSAVNGADFVAVVREQLGIELEIVDRETEAHLAAAGVGDLADKDAQSTVMFDIGGGSSEIIWLGFDPRAANRVKAWESLRLGVVSLAETFGGVDVSDEAFAAMTEHVTEALAPFVARVADEARCDRFHLLGTSGTVTTIAGVHLNLPRYDRRAVDGLWLGRAEVDAAITRLRAMSYAERAANACIGHERADLVLAGCAILEAIRRHFPAERLRIADRGLREGILSHMMRADGVGPHRRRRERW
jgi:exopolyphosphatase / guanosine-5'-triphosphate,3'-diphosphate pyrophosphatase